MSLSADRGCGYCTEERMESLDCLSMGTGLVESVRWDGSERWV